MKFMVVWKTAPGKYKAAVEQFFEDGRPGASCGQNIGPLARSRINAWLAPD